VGRTPHVGTTELERIISRLGTVVTGKNFEKDIFKLLFRKEHQEIKDEEKIREILSFVDNYLLDWHIETFGEQKVETIDFKNWKSRAMEHFSTELMSMTEFINSFKNKDESFFGYFNRMEKAGKTLKLKESFIIEIIKNNLRRNSFELRASLLGENKLTNL
jgi:NAD-specific glutamate dehydrogenase